MDSKANLLTSQRSEFDLLPNAEFRRVLEAGLDTVAWGTERVLDELASAGGDGFPALNHLTGAYSLQSTYVPMDRIGVRWSGFLAGRAWLLSAVTGRSVFANGARRIAKQLGPTVAERALGRSDVGFDVYYALCVGYEATGDEELASWALAATDHLAGLFREGPGVFVYDEHGRHSGYPVETIIDCAGVLGLPFHWAAARRSPAWQVPIMRHNAAMLEHGLVRPDWSTFQALALDPTDMTPLHLHTHQGWQDTSTWTRGQAWAIHGFTNAYEATGDRHWLDVATRLADWYIARLPEDGVPLYDMDDPSPGIPRDSCSAAMTSNSLIRLARASRDRAARYAPVIERTLRTLLTDYLSPGGVLLHGTWGRAPEWWGMGRFPQEDIMPYGNYWIAESICRLVAPDQVRKLLRLAV